MATFHVIQKRWIFYTFSIILFVVGVAAPFLFPLHLGTDLIGGDVLEMHTNISFDQIKIIAGPSTAVIQSQSSYLIKGEKIDKGKIVSDIIAKDKNAQMLRFERISPTVSGELRKKAVNSVVLVLLAIGLYVAFAFKSSGSKIKSWILGLVVVLTLFHDVVSSFGLFALLSQRLTLTFDIMVVTGFLVVAGFSVHDTIVVFDRLRENLAKSKGITVEVFNASVIETMSRSINTSLTAVLSIIPLVFMLPHLRSFLLTLIFGIIIGTYSSICVAIPLVYDMTRKKNK